MPTDFAIHDLTSNISHLPYQCAASSFFSTLPPWKAFDGGNNYWAGSGGGVDWLQFDSAAYGYILDNYSIKVNVVPEPNRAPKNWTMKGSNDALSWTTVDTVTNQTTWISGETRNFVCATRTTAYRYFRLDITANNGDATYTQVAELYLYGTYSATLGPQVAPLNMTSNTAPSPYVISASSVFTGATEYYAFAIAQTRWIGTGAGVDWLKIDLGSSGHQMVGAYDVVIEATAVRGPKDWTFEGSNNGSSWDVLETVTGQTGWAANERRTYLCSTVTTAYRYFRLNITANNGDATYTEVAEMYLFGIVGVGPPFQAAWAIGSNQLIA